MRNRIIVGGCYSLEVFHCTAENEGTAPLKARDYKDPLVVVYEVDNDNDEYISVGERGRNNTIVIGK